MCNQTHTTKFSTRSWASSVEYIDTAHMFIYNMLFCQLPHLLYSRSPFTHRLQLYMSMSINWTNLGSQNQSHDIMRYFSSLHRGLDRLRNSFMCLYSYTSECICIHNTYSNHSKCMRCEHVSLRVLQSKSSSSVATPFILATWLRRDTIEYYTHMTHVMKKNILVIGDWTMCMHHTVFSIDLRLEASIELSIFIQTHMHACGAWLLLRVHVLFLIFIFICLHI